MEITGAMLWTFTTTSTGGYHRMTQIVRMSGAKGEGLEIKKYKEILFPNQDFVDPERGMKYVNDFQYRRGDSVLCTYPKTGTHWIANILWKIKSFDESDRIEDTNLEFGPPEVFENQKDPRFIFSHQKPSRLYPPHSESNGKVILMLRNPKDVAVSYYYHMKNAMVYKNKQTWDEFFQSFVQGEIPFGSYFTYLREWEQLLKEISEGNSNRRVEVFYYEEFLLNPKENIVCLSKYLGFDRDDDYLERVLNGTTLGALRERYNSPVHKTANAVCCDDLGNSIIFRKGQVGDWKSHLTVAQSELIDNMLQDTLQHGLIKFKFEL